MPVQSRAYNGSPYAQVNCFHSSYGLFKCSSGECGGIAVILILGVQHLSVARTFEGSVVLIEALSAQRFAAFSFDAG